MPVCFTEYDLQAYIDGQLAPSQETAVATHLLVCPICRRVVINLQRVSLPLRQQSVATPDDLLDRVQAAVGEAVPQPAITCEQARLLASAVADDEATLDQRQQLQVHRDGCAECDRAAREILQIASLLQTVEPVPAPLQLLSRLQQAVSPAPTQRRRRWNLTRVLAAGAAAAAVWLAIALGPLSQPTSRHALTVALPPPATLDLPKQPAPPAALSVPAATHQPAVAVSRPGAVAGLKSRTSAGARLKHPARDMTMAEARNLSANRPAATTCEAATGVAATQSASQPPVEAASRIRPPVAPPAVNRPAAATGTQLALAPPATTTELPGRAGKAPVTTSARPAPAVPGQAVSTALPPPTAPAASPRLAALPDKPDMKMPPAAPENVKAAPAVETITPPRPALQRQRTQWVSRPVEEREVYRSEDLSHKLAMAQRNLDKDLRHIKARPAEWVIH
jgi:anti-sigma factor RsiW